MASSPSWQATGYVALTAKQKKMEAGKITLDHGSGGQASHELVRNLINGPIGDHGITVLTQREGLDFQGDLVSDPAPLTSLVAQVLSSSDSVHVLRDPTRGGVATALNEIAEHSGVGIELFEDQIPIRKEVRSACEILGLDPLYIANEGKVLVFLAELDVNNLLKSLLKHDLRQNTSIIGKVASRNTGRVLLRTRVGGTRIVTILTGEQLPRIC